MAIGANVDGVDVPQEVLLHFVLRDSCHALRPPGMQLTVRTHLCDHCGNGVPEDAVWTEPGCSTDVLGLCVTQPNPYALDYPHEYVAMLSLGEGKHADSKQSHPNMWQCTRRDLGVVIMQT